MTHKVCVIPEYLQQNANGGDFDILPLKHPRSHQQTQYAISGDGKTINEVLVHKPEFGSWLMNDQVISDGSLHLFTPVDPVFLILPYLMKHCEDNPNQFSPLEQILEDAIFPHTTKLCNCLNTTSLNLVADVKGGDDYKACKFNKEKTFSWIGKKCDRLVSHLKDTTVHVSQGAHSSLFVRGKTDDSSEDDYKRYAFGMISDYLPSHLGEEARGHLRIPDEIKIVAEEPATKKMKTENSSGPLEDYSKGVLAEKSTSQKLSANQKKYSKVDKTGMKSISSFFTPKAKKS